MGKLHMTNIFIGYSVVQLCVRTIMASQRIYFSNIETDEKNFFINIQFGTKLLSFLLNVVKK